MNALLVVVTIVSMLAAAGCGVVAWHLLRHERRRSDARVAALAGAIDGTPVGADAGPEWAARGSLFAAERSDGAQGFPLVKAGVVAAMALVVVIVAAFSSGWGAARGDSGAARASSARQGAPLELLSMRHDRDGDTLTVSGLVRNPRGANPVSRVTAIVFAFNRSGAYVTSGRAALDFTTIEPGEESPFVVRIPGVSDVGRYRVSFRTDAGSVRHVDRRADQMRLAASGLPR